MEQIISQISTINEQNNKFLENEEFDKIQDLTFIKGLEYDNKIEAIRYIMHSNVIDSVSILNLKILLSGLGMIDSAELEKSEAVWFNSLKELCDIVIVLRQDIEELAVKLFVCFIGIIKSLKITVNEATKTQKTSKTEDLLLRSLGFFGLSTVIRKIQTPIDLSEIACYVDGNQVLFGMSNQMNILEML